jgi:hypothetical protein
MTQEAIFSEEFWEKRHFIFFDYFCRCKKEAVRIDGEEIQSYEWVEPKRAVRMKLDTFTRRMVEAFLSHSGSKPKPGNRGTTGRR